MHTIETVNSAHPSGPNGSRTVRRARSRALFALLIVLSAGCSDAATQPAGSPTQPSSGPPPAPAPAFPPLSRPAVIYVGYDGIYDVSITSHGSTIASRFVFYEDSTFELQFASQKDPFFQYTGRFTREDSLITFDWDGSSTAGPWGATATLRGDSLMVAYNEIMQWSGFIDGVYVREPAQ